MSGFGAGAPPAPSLAALARASSAAHRANALVRATLYTFVFLIPFETPYRSLPFEASTLAGCLLLLSGVTQPEVCFRRPPAAFWWFISYLFMFCVAAFFSEGGYSGEVVKLGLSLLQLTLLFWCCYNLLRDEGVASGALLALAAGCLVRALLQLADFGNFNPDSVRITTFGQNPNSSAKIMAAGLLALLGLAYGRRRRTPQARFLVWLPAAALVVAIIQTGSRGGLMALAAGLVILFVRGDTAWLKFRNLALVSLAIGSLAWAVSRSETMSGRLAGTLESGDMAGRERIYPTSWEMFAESPWLGWGPVNNKYELGWRLMETDPARIRRDAHNTGLEVLTATGLLGALPFFAGVGLCVRAGWKARCGAQGSIPFALVAAVFVGGMSGNSIASEVSWLVMAHALAGGKQAGAA